MDTLVTFKFKGVPLVRLYSGKLDIFAIYVQLRSEFTPVFDEDIFIQSIKRVTALMIKYLSSGFGFDTTTLVPVTDLSVDLEANSAYRWKLIFFENGNSVEGWQVSFGGTAGVSFFNGGYEIYGDNSTGTIWAAGRWPGVGTAVTAVDPGGNEQWHVRAEGMIFTNGTPGTFNVNAAVLVDIGVGAAMEQGTFLLVEKVS